MKQTKLLFSTVVVATISVLMALFSGCEKDGDTGSDLDAYFAANPYISDPRDSRRDSDSAMYLSPDTAQAITVGQKILFTVSGGKAPFTWATATAAAGTIAAQGDDRQAIYTVVLLAKNNVIVSDSTGNAAIADISLTVAALSIAPTPGDIVAANGTTVNFTGSGGTPPYAWSVFDAAAGTINAGTGAYLIIDNTKTNYITVSDFNGESTSIMVY